MMNQFFFKKKIIGYTTSSNYSFCYKKNLCLGYVSGSFDNNQKLYLEVEGKKYPLIIEKKPIHDPYSINLRA